MPLAITALHTIKDDKVVTALGNLPGPDDLMQHDDLVELWRQIQQASIDSQRLEAEAAHPPRHPATPAYLEYPDAPAYDDACNFDPVGIDSEGDSHD